MVLETLVGPAETAAEAEAKIDTAELAQGEGEETTQSTNPRWRRAAQTR